jgi:hypothetical protein
MDQASALLESQEVTALGCGQVNHIVWCVSGQVQAQKGTPRYTALQCTIIAQHYTAYASAFASVSLILSLFCTTWPSLFYHVSAHFNKNKHAYVTL